MNPVFNLSQETLIKQFKYLSSNLGLYNLFDKFQANPPFSIPQHSLVIDLENITFGPDKYTVLLPQTTNQSFKIIYYSLLYYTFERNSQNTGITIYQKLLRFITSNDMALKHGQVQILDEQVKTYLVKFFHLLHRQKCKHKIIGDQLQTLPQMDLLLVHLIKKITKQQDLSIDQNATLIRQALKQQLDFHFEFLNTQTFAFQSQFVIDIRSFGSRCEFYIRRETIQNFKRIKDEITLQESAHFMMEQKQNLLISQQIAVKNTKKANLSKKQSIISSQLTQKVQENKKDDSVCSPKPKRKAKALLTFTPFGHKKEDSTLSTLSGDFFPEKKSFKGLKNTPNIFKNVQKTPKFGTDNNGNITTRIAKLKFNTNQENKLSNCSTQKKAKFSNGLSKNWLISANNTDSFHNNKELVISYSSKCITSELSPDKKVNLLQQKRIPSFIANRIKAKEQNQSKGYDKTENVNKPRITFCYKNK